ncbi:hypothetical protein C8Q79DRAFT_487874 [Trametes meyenii]|nr:hypothetical protein C8Q79DRAFT_487874 [Trametes meyenii]
MSAEYTPLPSEESSTVGGGEREARLQIPNASPDRVVLFCTIGVACTTVVSLLLFLGAPYHLPLQFAPPTVYAQSPFRPNPYVNLDKVPFSSGTMREFPPIVNFPQVVLQFDSLDVSREMREDERGKDTIFGAVYPDDRHVLVSKQVSTVVQFRNLDYAMERCILNISLPVGNPDFNPDISVSESSQVDVWILDNAAELAQDIRGTLGGAPSRRTLLATLPFPTSGGWRRSPEFHCPSGAFTTLELSCSIAYNTDCQVDFWQDRRAKPVGGVYIVQSSTSTALESSASPIM